MKNLINQYTELLQMAEETTNRKTAIKLIQLSTQVREQIERKYGGCLDN